MSYSACVKHILALVLIDIHSFGMRIGAHQTKVIKEIDFSLWCRAHIACLRALQPRRSIQKRSDVCVRVAIAAPWTNVSDLVPSRMRKKCPYHCNDGIAHEVAL